MAYLFDTNTLLRLAQKDSSERPTVIDAIRRLRDRGETLCYTPQVLAEFWNVCTRPSTARGGLDLLTEQTDRKANVIQKYFAILHDGPTTFSEWRRLVLDHQIRGVKVHDAKLVATMIANNVENLITFNTSDFQRFAMITAIHPADV